MPPDGAAELRRIIDMAEEVAWPDPEPLIDPTEAERPYPLDALPHAIAEAIREYQGYGQQPLPLVACSALASASLASQGLANVARDRHLIGPISLYFFSVAISGERKTSADRTFNRPIREWMCERRDALQPDLDKARADSFAWEAERNGLIAKIKSAAGKEDAGPDLARLRDCLAGLETRRPNQPVLPSLFHEDTNAATLAVALSEGWPSASIWSDEAGLVVGSHGMNDDNLMGYTGFLNRLWDGHDFDRSRLTVKSASLRGRRLTVSLMMQPIVFGRLLGAGNGASRGMGLIARSLPTWPASTIGSRPYQDAPDMPALDKFHHRLRELLDLDLPTEGAEMVLKPPVLTLSSKGFTEWRELHDDVESALSRFGEFASVPDIGAKIAENAARLAGVFHVFNKGPAGTIDHATMQGAAAVAVWHLNEARRIVGAGKIPADLCDAALLSEWLVTRSDTSIEPRDILRLGPPVLREKTRRDAAIKILIEKHHIARTTAGKTEKLTLNPKLRASE